MQTETQASDLFLGVESVEVPASSTTTLLGDGGGTGVGDNND